MMKTQPSGSHSLKSWKRRCPMTLPWAPAASNETSSAIPRCKENTPITIKRCQVTENSFNEIYLILKLYWVYFNWEMTLNVLICFLSLAKFSAPLCTWAPPRRAPLSPFAPGCCFVLPRPFSLCPLRSYRRCSEPPHRERSAAPRPNSAPCWSLPTPHRPKDTSVFTPSLFLCVISNKSLCVLLKLQLHGHSLYFIPGKA